MAIRKPIYCNRYAFVLIAAMIVAALAFGSCGVRGGERVTISYTTYSPSASAVNINKATSAELQKIPHIGEKLADRIVEHRELYGPFRRAEDLILIPGISDSRFRKIRDLIRVD